MATHKTVRLVSKDTYILSTKGVSHMKMYLSNSDLPNDNGFSAHIVIISVL